MIELYPGCDAHKCRSAGATSCILAWQPELLIYVAQVLNPELSCQHTVTAGNMSFVRPVLEVTPRPNPSRERQGLGHEGAAPEQHFQSASLGRTAYHPDGLPPEVETLPDLS